MDEHIITKPFCWEAIEEKANWITHGLGLALSIVGLIILLMIAFPDPLKSYCAAIFGISLVLLYAASTFYHASTHELTKQRLQVLDHCAIYVLIAGSYTPFALLAFYEASGEILFQVVWAIALVGIIFKLFFTNRFRYISTALYLVMGWLVVLVGQPIHELLPAEGFSLLLGGGLSYSFGTIFYLLERPLFHHAIWHMFVLGGSLCHYLAVACYIL